MRRSLLAILLAVTAISSAFAQSGGLSPAEDKKQLSQFSAGYKTAKANFAKKPKDSKTKQAYIAATNRLATASMYSSTLDRKVKYVQALRLYREVLKVDPKNHEAYTNSHMIESIYKQMGRPIPK